VTLLIWTYEAFHWFATEESLTEIHRVLRPGAAFGVSSLPILIFTLRGLLLSDLICHLHINLVVANRVESKAIIIVSNNMK